MPIGPGAGIEKPWWRIGQHLAQRIILEVAARRDDEVIFVDGDEAPGRRRGANGQNLGVIHRVAVSEASL